MPNPYSAIDAIVQNSVAGHVGVTAIVPVSKMQFWDRDVDIRGEIQTSADLGTRLWMEPLEDQDDWEFSNTQVRFVFRYRLGWGVAGMKLADLRDLKYAITQALARLQALKGPDGGVLEMTDISPLQIESITPSQTNPQRDPISDAQEWLDERAITVVAYAARSALEG